MATSNISNPRDFPSVEGLMQTESLQPVLSLIPRPIAVEAVQQVVETAKKKLVDNGRPITLEDLLKQITKVVRLVKRTEMTPVINATGILVHTNLGRSPLAVNLLESAREIAQGYCNIEFDLTKGTRGKRGVACERYLAHITGAEAATVVNNCAAALFLMLNTIANRKRVLISRGELVQIGGGFRIPDILRKSGAKLVEVGTTNITTVSDYEQALDDGPGIILKVHKSNFIQAGFTEEASLADLVELAQSRDSIVINDLGSGVLIPTRDTIGFDEPTVQQSVRSGANLTSFSGDKLLGGVQAGLIVGSVSLIQKVKKNPLFRAMRIDKIAFAMLERLLTTYLNGTHVKDTHLWSMLRVPESELYQRAKRLVAELGNPDGVSIESTGAYVGGGSLPESPIPSVGIVFAPELKAKRLVRAFRESTPPIIGRVEDDRFILDLRAVGLLELDIVATAIRTILG